MDGTIQEYVLDMAADTKKEPLRVKQYDTNSRQARITLKMGGAMDDPIRLPDTHQCTKDRRYTGRRHVYTD